MTSCMKELEQTAYQEALDYLYSFVDYSLTRNFRYAPDKFDLGRVVRFLDLLGNPHCNYPIFHVAGTKGKGSTSALIASALQAAGYRVGLYTSPHLQEFTERIQVDGQEISRAELAEIVAAIQPSVSQVERLTTFELTTAVGFLYFTRKQVDVAVVEVGLGGRLDATNVIDPLLSIITAISLDHTAVLGDTVEKIAFEKAGIIKPSRPVVMAPQKEEARKVIREVAAQRGSRLIEVGEDCRYSAGEHSLAGQDFSVWMNGSGHAIALRIPLLGMHQVENGATAYTALQVAREQGIAISDQAIKDGFARVRWPGRFDVLHWEPFLVADSAHNRDSALRLRQAIDDYFPGRPVTLLFGASEDKDVEGILAELLPRAKRFIATQSIHPRAADPVHLVKTAARYGCQGEVVTPVEEALCYALRQTEKDGVVLATGSLFIVAAVRETWQKMGSELALAVNEAERR